MGVVRRVIYQMVKFAIYIAAGLIFLFPRIPDEAPRDFGEGLILLAALSAIYIAVTSTTDWVRGTVLDIIARRKAKRDERDRAASVHEGGHPGAGDSSP